MTQLTIALLQFAAEAELAQTLAKGLDACREARRQGADIALFPEIWSHGYRFFDPRVEGAQEAWRASALDEDAPFVQRHRQAARELDMAIGLTYLGAGQDGPLNAFALIDRRGEIVLRYAKVHVCQHTIERCCAPGAGFDAATLETAAGPVRVGAMICYDREFPESARVLALMGAELALVPNACLFDDHRLAQMKTRAFENKLVLAMTNYPASHPEANGRSLGISAIAFDHAQASQSTYRETLLLETGPDEGVFTFAIDLDELRRYRRNAIWGAPHRHPHAYGVLVDPAVDQTFAPDELVN